MSPLRDLDEAIKHFLNGDTSSTALLAACSTYIAKGGDWREVVDVMRDDLNHSKAEVIDWFVAQDEPDLASQVEFEWIALAAEAAKA